MKVDSISKNLGRMPAPAFSFYCIIAAFGTYFCMYAFRKPFTAATYEGLSFFGIGLKTALIAAQVAGYTLSKFLGIKFVSEMAPTRRAIAIIGLILVAELALILFAITPAPWNIVWLFLNGLPLGMIFGLVLGFLEGRKTSEALAAGLCASFILSSGFVKSVGRILIEKYQVDIFWMPFLTGLIFLLPLLGFVWMLAQIPPPSPEDILKRTERQTMDRKDRLSFFRRHAPALSILVFIYILLTVARSIRDDFAVEIWRDLGVENTPSVYAMSEFWIMIGVMFACGASVLISNNRVAFLCSIAGLTAGFAITSITLVAQSADLLSPMLFMVSLGFGMYLPYAIFHTTVFERMIAAFAERGNVGYLIYLADAAGYLGYIAVLVGKNLYAGKLNYLALLKMSSLAIAITSMFLTIWLFFHLKGRLSAAPSSPGIEQ